MTIPQLKKICKLYSLSILFLSEMKNKQNCLHDAKKKLDFDELAIVNSIGKAGGLALMWNKDVQIQEALKTSFTIEVLIHDTKNSVIGG